MSAIIHTQTSCFFYTHVVHACNEEVVRNRKHAERERGCLHLTMQYGHLWKRGYELCCCWKPLTLKDCPQPKDLDIPIDAANGRPHDQGTSECCPPFSRTLSPRHCCATITGAVSLLSGSLILCIAVIVYQHSLRNSCTLKFTEI